MIPVSKRKLNAMKMIESCLPLSTANYSFAHDYVQIFIYQDYVQMLKDLNDQQKLLLTTHGYGFIDFDPSNINFINNKYYHIAPDLLFPLFTDDNSFLKSVAQYMIKHANTDFARTKLGKSIKQILNNKKYCDRYI